MNTLQLLCCAAVALFVRQLTDVCNQVAQIRQELDLKTPPLDERQAVAFKEQLATFHEKVVTNEHFDSKMWALESKMADLEEQLSVSRENTVTNERFVKTTSILVSKMAELKQSVDDVTSEMTSIIGDIARLYEITSSTNAHVSTGENN